MNQGQQQTFIGRYYHALEQKGRVSIPKTFRHQLGEEAVVTTGLDGCLFMFSGSDWQAVAGQAATLPFTKKAARDWVRLLSNNASVVNFDRLGRILLPDYLRQQAGLAKEVVIVGSFNRIEIWDRDRYHRYLEELEARAEEVSENISELESKV